MRNHYRHHQHNHHHYQQQPQPQQQQQQQQQHQSQHQQHQETRINVSTISSICPNSYQFCLHPVMAATATNVITTTTLTTMMNSIGSNNSSNNNTATASGSATTASNIAATESTESASASPGVLLASNNNKANLSSSQCATAGIATVSSQPSPLNATLTSSVTLAMSQNTQAQRNDNSDQLEIINNNVSHVGNIASNINSINNSSSNNNTNNNTNTNNHNNINDARKSCNKVLLKDSPTFTELIQTRSKRLSPTQESSNMSFSSASVAGSIQDDIGDQCGLTKAGLEEYTMRANSFYDNPVLYHHQKQSSYAQSEGYHSYVSSSDSTSATPMLDRLRQESDLLSRQASHNWSQNDLSSLASTSVAASPTLLMSRDRDLSELSVSGIMQQQQQQQLQHNNSSESTSSTETLKWLGSMSDVSDVSHATGFSAISESVSTSQLIVHSSRVLTPKRHQSESVLFPSDEQPQTVRCSNVSSPLHQHHSPSSLHTNVSNLASSSLVPNHRHSPSYPPVHHTSHSLYRHHQHHQVANTSPELSKTVMNEKISSQTNISVTISNSEAVVTISPNPPPATAAKHIVNGCNEATKLSTPSEKGSPDSSSGCLGNSAAAAATGGAAANTSCLAIMGNKSVSASMDSLADIKGSGSSPYRNNHRLFPVSTYSEPVHNNTSQFVHHPKPQYSSGLPKAQKNVAQQQHSPSGGSGSLTNLSQSKIASPNYPQPSWQSVAALINDFERSNDSTQHQHQQQQQHLQQQQQPQKYTYLDPNKIHRVPNPALKAFQKNAVQSYFERQQQQQQQPSPDSRHSPKSYHLTATTALRNSPSSPQHSGESVQTVLLRNSLPSNYNTSTAAIQRPLSEDKNAFSSRQLQGLMQKPPSPAPPPPPPRSRSMMPTVLRRSSSASDYAELRDQFMSVSQEKLQSQSIKNISNSEKFSFNDCGMPPPPPPPRGRPSMNSRRTSSASDYAGMRDKVLLQQAAALTHQQLHPHQHPTTQHISPLMSNSYHGHQHHHQQHPHPHPHHPHHGAYFSASAALPIPPPIAEGWVPERPPKNPNLRVPSPELPPPPPGLESESSLSDEPLPPPPPEILHRQPLSENNPDMVVKPPSPNRRNSFAGASTRKPNNFFATRTTSTESGINKGPPPLVPRKPATIELLQVARPSAASLTKLQPELLRASITSSSTRKRPHNLASTSNIQAIQENVTTSNNNNSSYSQTRHSPNGANIMKSSPPPPPLMPRMLQGIATSNILLSSPANVVAASVAPPPSATAKSRCNSKASYLPRQSLEKQSSSDPDHGSYKLTLHSNEDLVGSTKSTYDILAQTPKIPSNLPDVLPLGVKLQPAGNSTASLRYGSNNNLSSAQQSPTQTSAPNAGPNCYPDYPPPQQQQQRYSTPVLNSFNLSNNFSRSQSFDTNANANNNHNHSSTKYMSQSSLDLKRPSGNLETTIEEQPHPLADNSSSKEQQNSSLSSINSLSESCASHEEILHSGDSASGNVSNNNNELSSMPSIFRAELVNTTFTQSNKKSSVCRQESLRENIEKITQLQSQLMSAHITDSGFLGSYTSSLSAHTNASKTSQANVIDIPKTVDLEESLVVTQIQEALGDTPPSFPDTPPPPPLEDELIIKTATACTTTCRPKSPKISQEKEVASKQVHPSVLLSQFDSSTDSLKLVQRSEIILRVNPSTVETASQTDDIADSELKSLTDVSGNKDMETANRTTLQPRQRLPIEDECEKMSKELATMLPANDVLVLLLCPPSNKKVDDYVSNLYNPNVPQRPTKRDVGTSTLTRSHKNKEDEECNEKMTVELKLSENDSTADNCDILKNKVNELIKYLNSKIRFLGKEQATIDEEWAVNDELGNSLMNKLCDKVRPIEESKCRTYIADVGHITGLLLSLSERLARAENQLTALVENNSEKKSLETKRDRLYEQLTEAKRLKADIDRRGVSVNTLLEKNLTSEEYADFEYFINMKAKLITDSRDITDKIKTGEEIIAALSDTLIQSDC